MGMYAHVDDREIKFSWPLSEAIRNAIGSDRLDPMVEDYVVVLSKGDVECVIHTIHEMLTNGIEDKVSEPGTMSDQYSMKVGNLAWNIDSLLRRWYREADHLDELVFG
jgi:hypothetical protein